MSDDLDALIPASHPAKTGPSPPSSDGLGPSGFDRALMSTVPFARDIGAAGSALGEMSGAALSGKEVPNFSESWKRNRQADVDQTDAYIKDHPILGRVAEGFGVLASMGSAPASAAAAAPSLAARTATGAGVGGLYAGGTSDGDLTERAEQAAAGMVGGGALGAAAPLIAKGVGAAAGGVRDLVGKFTPPNAGEIEDKAGQTLLDIAGGKPPVYQPEPLPGMKVTPGQASNNPALLREEDVANQSMNVARPGPNGQMVPSARELAFGNQTSNNTAIRTGIGQLGDLSAADQAPAIMQQHLEEAQKNGRTATRLAWDKAGLDQSTPIPSAPLKQGVQDYLDNLVPIERTKIPLDWLKGIEDLGDTTNLKELQAFRADIGDTERAAYRSGNNNEARIVGGLSDLMQTHTEDPAMIGMANINPDYQAARAATRQFKQTFNQPTDVRNALGVDRYGADKIPISAVADTFIRSGKGAPEALQSYLTAVGNDPVALDAARSAFAQKMLDNVTNTTEDLLGNKIVSAPKLSNFLDSYDHVVNSPLFTQDQRNLIGNISDASLMASRSGAGTPGGGSATVSRLSGNKYLDALMGTWPARFISSGAGAVAGSIAGGPLGMVAGATLGGAGGDALVNALYRAPQEKMLAILNQALHDSTLAHTLMSKASAGTTATMPGPVRSYLQGVLSNTANTPVLSGVIAGENAGSSPGR